MRGRWITYVCTISFLTFLLLACGSDDVDDPGSSSGDSTPTVSASPTTTTPPTSIASPTDTPSISIADLTTLDWQLAEIDGVPIHDASIVTMNLVQRDDNLIQGYGDCHSYLAGIDWDDTTLRISDSGPFPGIDASERVCQNPAIGPEQDAAFFKALSETMTYQASNEMLVFHDADGQSRLTFVPRQRVAIDPALTETTWLLTLLNGTSLVPDTAITMAFGHEGISGNDGCNEYGSGFLIADDGRLLLVGGFGTAMACQTPEGVMEQADHYTQTLSYVAAYRVDGSQLQLLDHSGSILLIYMREDAEAFDPALAAHRWGLIETNGQPAVPDSLVMFAFSEGYITGTNSCNGITGAMPIAVDGTLKIDFAGFARDAQGCLSPEITAQAERVEAILEDATSYAIDGDVLTIDDGAGNEVTFGPAAEVLLIGRTWNVPMLYTELPGGEIRGDALVEGTEITLTFNADGTLGGNASCNTYGGTYTLDGASIAIDSLTSTKMACPNPPGIMEQETSFLDTLQAVTSWDIGANGLTLTTDDERALRELNVVIP